ncbi:hypothetical protein NLJ89_g2599 [Agrocybe chaxingu]|uniref:non-specific serine/threonine protein kinase n=1 Tax=Agrocybe chaxingu TaxID=84603 RepID=A0A9W8KAY2_9AGAR|nr:hypothetical protein NLJ89_g2599 [Agrocybe chaxingu]
MPVVPTWLLQEESPDRYRPGGYRPTTLGEHLHSGRYEVLSKIGHGASSTMWLARDNSHAAGDSAMVELASLKRLSSGDHNHPGYACVPTIHDSFWTESRYGKHLCIATDVLGLNLFELPLKFQSIEAHMPEIVVKRVMRDLLSALDYCHNQCQIIHTDVKLSNILSSFDYKLTASDPMIRCMGAHEVQVEDGSTVIITQASGFSTLEDNALDIEGWKMLHFKLVDFGSAFMRKKSVFEEYGTQPISPPLTRSPEAFIGAPWNASTDIWSVGMTLFQLLTGSTLFAADAAEIAFPLYMYQIFGRFPATMIKASQKGAAYFNPDGTLHPEFAAHDQHLSLQAFFESLPGEWRPSPEAIEFQMTILKVNPQERPTAHELLQHPWLSDVV